MTRPGPLLLTLLALLTALLAGCAADPTQGYSFADTRPGGIRTVHVPIFRNDTLARGIEIELTDAIMKEIKRSTPWRVTGPENADATLSGAILESRLRTISTGRDTGLSQEVAVNLLVDFDLRSTRTGQSVVSRRRFGAAEVFVPALGVGERLEVGEHATVQELAQALVAELRSNW